MSAPANEKERIFTAAAELAHPQQRKAFLDAACGGDAKLRREVEGLLTHDNESSSFLEVPAVAATTDAFPPIAEGAGTIIGHYKLLQKIGEGGFGVVYMAEQQEPVRRKVAFKIIKPGMDTREVIARFESERQALALMDHPNIARVLDAGATESGRPYFVMELVKGVPITEYCDKNNLPAEKRLELFITVCHAVQHAHQKGVIHRDLKPTNVMVTLHDGTPVPKVIDFGVAKATSQRLTERTLFTAYGQMVGTPAYMSPEQAEMSGLDIDTRSDIYSLGVLLYELLTGTTPFDGKRLRDAGYAEMQRIIREEEPPRPSTRVSTLGVALTVVSSHRSTDPAKLRQTLRGDLDLIVMKAMEKERSRRYDSPNSFADDIQRYLSHEAILARPASAAYRLRKLVQRNKAAVATAAAIAVTLLVGVVVSTGLAIYALNQANLARTNLAEADKQKVAAVTAKSLAERERDHAEKAKEAEGQQHQLAEQQRQEAEAARKEEASQRAVAERERDKSDNLNQQLQATTEDQRRAIYSAEMNLVRLEAQRNNVGRMRELLLRQVPGSAEEDLRGFEWNYWYRYLHRAQEILRFDSSGLSESAEALTIVPEGNLVACTRGNKTEFLELPSGKRRGTIAARMRFDVNYTSLTNQGRMVDGLAQSLQFLNLPARLSTPPSSFQVWEVTGKNWSFEFPEGTLRHLSYLQISGNGRCVAALGIDASHRPMEPACRLLVWDVESGQMILNKVEGRELNRLALNHDGTQVVAFVCHSSGKFSNDSRDVAVAYDLTTRERMAVLKHDDDIDAAYFLPGGNRLLLTSLGCSGRNRKELFNWTIGEDSLRRLGNEYMPDFVKGAVNHDGSLYAVGGASVSTIRLIDTNTGTVVLRLHNEATNISSLTFSSDGKRLIACGTAGLVLAWDLAQDEDLFRLRANPLQQVTNRDFVLSQDQSLLAISTAQRGLRVRRRDGSETILQPGAAATRVIPVEFSPDNQLLVGQVADSLRLFETASGKMLWTWPLPVIPAAPTPVSRGAAGRGIGDYLPIAKYAFSADSRQLVVLRGNRTYVVETASDKRTHQYELGQETAGVETGLVRERRTGRLCLPVLVPQDNASESLRLLDAVSGQIIAEASIPSGQPVTHIVAAPDTRHVGLVHREASRVAIWDLIDKREVLPSTLGSYLVFSGDGQRAAILQRRIESLRNNIFIDSIERVPQITLWDVPTGRLLSTITLAGGTADEVRFSPDGQRLLTLHGKVRSGAGGSIPEGRLWDVRSGRELMTIPVADVNHYTWELMFDPAGSRVTALVVCKTVGSGGGWGSLVFDGAPLTEDEDASLLARACVAELFRQHILVSRVVAALQTDSKLKPRVRDTALALVRQRGDDPVTLADSCLGLLSRGRLTADECSQALRFVEALVELEPNSPRTAVLLGGVQFRARRYAEALATLTPPPTYDSHQQEDGAEQRLEILRQSFLALTQHALGKTADAQELAFRILEKWRGDRALFLEATSGSAQYYGPWAVANEVVREIIFTRTRTIEEINEAVKRNPSNPRVYADRGLAWRVRGEYDNALRDYSESIRLDPSNAYVVYLRGQTWSLKGDLDNAIRDYDESIRLDPQVPGPHNARGNARRFQGDFQAALRDYNEAIRLDPAYAVAYCNRGELQRLKGELDDALKDYGEAIRLDRQNASAYLERGRIWELRGEYDKALADYDQSIRLAPGDVSPYGAKAWLLATRLFDKFRNGKQAVADATKACELTNWKEAGPLANLAAAYAETGNFEEAIKYEQKAIGLATLDAEKARYESRLQLYREGKPYRDPPPTTVQQGRDAVTAPQSAPNGNSRM